MEAPRGRALFPLPRGPLKARYSAALIRFESRRARDLPARWGPQLWLSSEGPPPRSERAWKGAGAV